MATRMMIFVANFIKITPLSRKISRRAK